ncbi:LptF/LptG family permease [Verrucomicrobia bacterium]|nr:LptF/LptG family permease [Verrucomicrobiota bacterium]
MRLLDRYLIKELAMPFGFCLLAFFILWTGNDLFNQLALFNSKEVGPAGILTYYFLKSPEFFGTIAPVALLFGMLFALSRHARYNELIAARAAGISIWRLAAPYYFVGFISGLLIFMANTVWMPNASQQADALIGGKKTQNEPELISPWAYVNDVSHREWHAASYNRITGAMEDIQLHWQDNDKWCQLTAVSGSFTNRVWSFQKVFYREYLDIQNPPGPTKMDSIAFNDFSETPSIIESERKVSNMSLKRAAKKIRFTLAEIREYMELHPNLRGKDYSMMHTQLHAHLSMPWTCLIVVIIAIPFGTLNARKNLFTGFAGTVFICFLYFVLERLGRVLGTSGDLPPWAGAWLANIIFAIGGIFTTWKLR